MKKLTLGELRGLVREELLRGIPDFELRASAAKFAAELKQHMLRYVQTSPADATPADRAEAIRAVDETVASVETEIHELLQDRIYGFLRRV